MFVYALTSDYINQHGQRKIGSTQYPVERMRTYNTGDAPEIGLEKRYEGLWKVDAKSTAELRKIEYDIHSYFERYRVSQNREWFRLSFHDVDSHMDFIKGNRVSADEVLVFNQKGLEKANSNDFKVVRKEDREYESILKNLEITDKIEVGVAPDVLEIIPNGIKQRPYQVEIIDKALIHFQSHNKGAYILMCGVGKTLISLWVCQKLDVKTILIGVPNILLLKQWEKVIKDLFPNMNILTVNGKTTTADIKQFLKKYGSQCVVITTYKSCFKVEEVTTEISFKFDMKLLDEFHHLTVMNIKLSKKKGYIRMLNIESIKQLALTATLKQVEGNDENIISNDNVRYFGEIVDKKGLLWAINQNIVCDYVVQTIVANEDQLTSDLEHFNLSEENDKRLFLSAFASLKSISDGNSHHLVIYSNCSTSAGKIISYIQLLIDHKYFVIPGFYFSEYNSKMKSIDREKIIKTFKRSTYGILTCIYCLGEGWDFPLLDGVVFSENMTSSIRIVQSALRAGRKNPKEPAKHTKIILPILNRDDWLENNDNHDLKKVRQVIHQMGLEDETISQKIKVYQIQISRQKPKIETKSRLDEFGEYDDELTRKLLLKTVKRTALGTTYEKARKIIREKAIQTKEDYFMLCDNDDRLSKDPEIVFRGCFTNWIEYLSIPRIYYDIDTCKKQIDLYIHRFSDVSMDLATVCDKLCKLDKQFPPNGLWVDYYNVKSLGDIISITTKRKKIMSPII